MKTQEGRVRALGGDKYATPRPFTPETMDPRNAKDVETRDRMIEIRVGAGLTAFPQTALFPEVEATFEPTVHEMVATR